MSKESKKNNLPGQSDDEKIIDLTPLLSTAIVMSFLYYSYDWYKKIKEGMEVTVEVYFDLIIFSLLVVLFVNTVVGYIKMWVAKKKSKLGNDPEI